MIDPLFRMLGSLPQAQPDPARAARIRARCHAALAQRSPRPSPRPAGAARWWEPLVAGLGGIYLTESIRQALSLAGIL